MTFNEFKNNVELWAAERGIYDHSSAEAQLMKALSELGELADAIIKGDDEAIKDAVGDVAVCVVNAANMEGVALDEVPEWLGYIAQRKPSVKVSSAFAVGCIAEGIGSYLAEGSDAWGALVLPLGKLAELCAHEKISFMACCEHAWNQIKDRKGRMVAGGAFVKGEDEQKQDGALVELRDRLAGQVMAGMVANDHMVSRFGLDAEAEMIEPDVLMATAAYRMADAMLKERSK